MVFAELGLRVLVCLVSEEARFVGATVFDHGVDQIADRDHGCRMGVSVLRATYPQIGVQQTNRAVGVSSPKAGLSEVVPED